MAGTRSSTPHSVRTYTESSVIGPVIVEIVSRISDAAFPFQNFRDSYFDGVCGYGRSGTGRGA